MAMKVVIDTLEEVAEPLRTEYKEGKDKDGKTVYHLDIEGEIGLHPQGKKLKDENAQRRQDVTKLTAQVAKYAPLGERNVDEILQQLDRIPVLEEAAKGKLDETKIGEMVETRVKGRVAGIERERDGLKTQVAERDGIIDGFKKADVSRKVSSEVTKAAKAAKVLDLAMEDVEMYGERIFELTEDGVVQTKDGVGVIPGLSPKAWLEDMATRKTHWFGTTAGGGAGGGKGGAGGAGDNPWTHDNWNMTKQGDIVRADRAKADRLAAAAGTTVGGRKPVPKK